MPIREGSKAMLTIDSLSKQFSGFQAVENCSFEIKEGTITGLIGPNGAGKSTVFNMVAGNVRPTSGRVIYCGQDITYLSPEDRFDLKIARTFQIPHEFSKMTTLENLMVVPPLQKGEFLLNGWLRWGAVLKQEKKIMDKAREVLNFLGLDHVSDERSGNLSGGQKKLLELGRTMMCDPKLVLLDEPAAGVNRTLLLKLAEMIKNLQTQRGYTFCLIEHDLNLIASLCDPVVCMAHGSVLALGTFEDVRSNKEVQEAYIGGSAQKEEAA